MAFEKMSEEDFYLGIRNKMMGQVNLVRIGKDYLKPKGSITLTTGILADDPVHGTTGAALVNGGIHSFIHAVKDELGNGIRINAVSPGLVEDSEEKNRAPISRKEGHSYERCCKRLPEKCGRQ